MQDHNVRVAICNYSIKSNLVEVRSLKLQHLVDACFVDRVCSLLDLCRCTITSSESSRDELLTVLVEQVKGRQVGARGDLDKLGKSVSNLGFGQRSEEGKVQECLHGCMVSTQSVLVIAIVDGNFDRD